MKRKIILLTILISGMFFFFSLEKEYKMEKENEEKINNFFVKLESTTNKETSLTEEQYLGVLEIPKIKLKRGFYTYNSKENTVDKNIELISKNCIPNEDCLFILASHSGTSSISFFKNLDQLEIQDNAILYYGNQKYTYQLAEIIYQEKNGTISLKNQEKSELILTTCNKENNFIQNIYRFVKQ